MSQPVTSARGSATNHNVETPALPYLNRITLGFLRQAVVGHHSLEREESVERLQVRPPLHAAPQDANNLGSEVPVVFRCLCSDM